MLGNDTIDFKKRHNALANLAKAAKRQTNRAAKLSLSAPLALLALLLNFTVLACSSDQAIVPKIIEQPKPVFLDGWQENSIAQVLNIQQYLVQDADLSLRFFYQTRKPEQSYAEIRSPLLPNTVLRARAANFTQELTKPQVSEQSNTLVETEEFSETTSPHLSHEAKVIARRTAEIKQDFYFPLELEEASILWRVDQDKFEIRYQLSGLLALTRNNPDDSFFSLERLSDLRLGELLAVELPSTDEQSPAAEEASTQQDQNDSEEQSSAAEESAAAQQSRLLHAVRQYLDDLNLFMTEIFAHRQGRIFVAGMSSNGSQLQSDWQERVHSIPVPSKPTASTPLSELAPLPLVRDQLDDVLAVYFFPEILDRRQQHLLPEEQRLILEKQYQITWAEDLTQEWPESTAQEAALGSEFNSERYTWNAEYSKTMFQDERLRQLRNSGQLWGQYQNFKETLQVLYNLRYVPNIIIPKTNQLTN